MKPKLRMPWWNATGAVATTVSGAANGANLQFIEPSPLGNKFYRLHKSCGAWYKGRNWQRKSGTERFCENETRVTLIELLTRERSKL